MLTVLMVAGAFLIVHLFTSFCQGLAEGSREADCPTWFKLPIALVFELLGSGALVLLGYHLASVI